MLSTHTPLLLLFILDFLWSCEVFDNVFSPTYPTMSAISMEFGEIGTATTRRALLLLISRMRAFCLGLVLHHDNNAVIGFLFTLCSSIDE